MLAFDVIKLEQHRALQQNAARVYLPEFRSELSLIARSSSGPTLTKLNRQIPEFKRRVTFRKQTTETCSNRQKIEKRLRPIPESTSFSSARDLGTSPARKMELLSTKNEAVLAKWAPTSNRNWSANRCYRKQTIKPCLTGTRMHFRETAFRGNFRISAAPPSDELRLRSEAPETLFQSSNLSETYGRS
jgi:hypothetical protein